MMFSIIFCIWTLREFQWRDVTSFDSVTVIHCRNHWHHHWRRRIHRCRASIGASGCMEGKVSKGVLNLPNGCFFLWVFTGKFISWIPKKLPISFGYICDFWYYWGWNSKWGGMRDFPILFFSFWGDIYIMDTQNSNKVFFFFVTCVPLNMDDLFLQTFPTGTCAPLFSICAFLCRRH